MDRYVLKERRDRAFASLCLKGIRAAIKRADAAENPNVAYLRSLEQMAACYAKEDR